MVDRFQEFIPAGSVPGEYDRALYDLSEVAVPVFAIYGSEDTWCPGTTNQDAMASLIDLTNVWVSGVNHSGLISGNSVALTDLLGQYLPETFAPITLDSLCPTLSIPDADAAKCKSSDSDCDSSDSDSDKEPKARPPKSGAPKG
mgnify:FL=1